MTKTRRAARLLSRSGVGALLRRLPTWNGILTLCFHRIGERGESAWERGLWDTTVEGLDRRLAFLRRNAEVLSPADLLGLEAPPRGRHVLVTFDDGYREWATEVLPVLRGHGVTAAFFIATGFIDRPRAPWWYELPWMIRHSPRQGLPAGEWLAAPLRFGESPRDDAAEALLERYKQLPGERCEAFLEWVAETSESGRCDPGSVRDDWLTWDMVRELRDAGMEVGGHTVDHPILARLGADEQRAQVAGCAARIEDELGQPMRMFAYPVGQRDSFDAASRAALREAGVELAFAFHGGFLGDGRELDRLALPRISGGADLRVLRAALALPQWFARW